MRTFYKLILVAGYCLSTITYASEQLTPVAHWNERASSKYNDVWGYTDEDGNEYALLGVRDGTSVIRLYDQQDPVEVGFIPSARSTWKDIKTYEDFAYVVNESGGGLQIIDLSPLPDSPPVLASTWNGFSTSHNLSIDTDRGLLFAEGNHAMPVRTLSLADPLNPVALSSFGVECHDIFARDGVAFISEGGHGTIGAFDYTDPENISLRFRFQIPNAGYVHNAWLSKDNRYLMTTEETSNKTIKMWNIENPDDVRFVSEYLAPGKLAHNAHIKGDYAYISHYGSGLRIVDVSGPEAMQEAAWFSVNEQNPGGFVGAWGAYPFFKSGRVLVSYIESGLYVVNFPGAVEP